MLKILDKIKRKKIPLNEYIDLCLYKLKSSYYEKKNIFGPRGDFITSPYVSSIFGEILAIHIANYFLEKNIFNFNILEIGAGEGLMAKDIIKTLSKFNNIKFTFSILEKSKKLKIIQKKQLKALGVNWVSSFNKINEENLFIISNELLDALPVKHLKKINDNWYEKFIFYNKEKKIIDSKYFPLKQTNIPIFKFTNYNTKFIEYSPDIFALLNKVIKLIMRNKNNCFLTIDYGYYSEHFEDTLQGLKKHKKVSIYSDPGNIDITYLINFNLINKIISEQNLLKTSNMTQAEFLISMGINARMKQVQKILKSTKEKRQLQSAVNRLIDFKKMGQLFKVLIITNEN